MPPDEQIEEGEEQTGEAGPKPLPPFGSPEWVYYWGESEGHLPSPINVSITNAIKYQAPDLVWYNYDIYPHKIKVTNTGYTVVVGAKWRTERPYIEGGPFFHRLMFSQIHFHWGAHMMEGSDHAVDERIHPAEMQVTYFRADYMTQEEALRHPDGVVVVCYLIKYGVNPDVRLQRIVDAFPRIHEAETHTRVGPYPMSQIMPLFYEDYFLYWGRLDTVRGQSYVVRWLVPRITLSASLEQMKAFRRLGDPWDEPQLRNFRPLQSQCDRHLFLIRPHWNLYNSLLPIPRLLEPSISVWSENYKRNYWMLPPQNKALLEECTDTKKKEHE